MASSIDPTTLFLLLLLLIVGIISLVLALRNRLSFRIAMRNVRRGRWRTVLVIAGLLVGTTIISGSFVVGNTVTAVNLHFTYLAGGNVYETIAATGPTGGFVYFPYSTYAAIAANASSHPDIAGITPMIVDVTQLVDHRTGIPETNLNLIATNATTSSALGSFVATSGGILPGPSTGQVYVDSMTAQAINATVGDAVTLYGPHPIHATIQAIVQENTRGAFLTAGVAPGNVFVDIPTGQTLQNQSGKINYIAVTNSGSTSDALAATGSVSAFLNTTIAAIPAAHGLVVHQPLQEAVSASEMSSQNTETIFLVLGLFSIAAGVVLIVGIFLMLAEERKGEMGMLRAIGLKRGHLIQVFYFEGLAYAAGSALAGAFLGVGVGYALAYVFSIVFASEGPIISAAILASFTVSGQSLLISYVLGFLLTLATVVGASYRASRLNIVRAIRDIPEPPPQRRIYSYLAILGGLLILLGALLFFPNYRGSGDISTPLIGGALMIVGLGLVASRFLKNRPVFTAVGVALIVWAGFEPLHLYLLGSTHSGGIFVLFVDGITMIFGALLVYIFNAPVLVAVILRLTGGAQGKNPVSRVALSYPARAPTRTSINLTIFALVIFTMVSIACVGASIEANLANTISTQDGGYDFVGFSAQPIQNFSEQVTSNATLAPYFQNVVPMISGGVNVNVTGFSANPFSDTLYAGPANATPTSSFYATSQFPFAATQDGRSASSILQELETQPGTAIVDNTYHPSPGGFGSGVTFAHPDANVGTVLQLSRPGTNNATNVTVIGVLKESIITGVFVNPTTANALGYHAQTVYLMSLKPGVSSSDAAQQTKKAFFPYGLVLFNLGALLATSIDNTVAVIGLLEIFVGLGLAVGIAAMGILALRAVVERRREIGMLRATGFTQGMVLRSFLLEYSFVALLGILVGTGLGMLIVYNLTVSPSAAADGIAFFAVPVTNILLVLGLSYGLAMLAIAGPSIRASRMPPAEAVRSTE